MAGKFVVDLGWLRRKAACEEGVEVFTLRFGWNGKADVKQAHDLLVEKAEEEWLAWFYGQEYELTKEILELCHDVDFKVSDSEAIGYAIENRDIMLIELLLDNGIDIEDVPEEDIDVVILNGEIDILKFLCGKGLELDLVNDEEYFQSAVESNDKEMIKFFIEISPDLEINSLFLRNMLYHARNLEYPESTKILEKHIQQIEGR